MTTDFADRRVTRLFFKRYGDHQDLHSFPTRRSSDLQGIAAGAPRAPRGGADGGFGGDLALRQVRARPDRKSTRLNSSHANISYAVFCLKKKNRQEHWHSVQ